jgi:transcriptional regulator with XRE-family HTH domain
MKRLGERIKRKREEHRMRLNELAAKVGVSSSALSQIEKAKAFPSIVTLKSIADNLHTTVGELIGEHEALSNNPLVRYNEVCFIEGNDNGCSSYLLSNHGPNKQMDTLLLKFAPGANSEKILKPHPGQTFLFALEGDITVELDGNSFHLKEKDSFYLNSHRPHIIQNNNNKEALVIIVSTPPVE